MSSVSCVRSRNWEHDRPPLLDKWGAPGGCLMEKSVPPRASRGSAPPLAAASAWHPSRTRLGHHRSAVEEPLETSRNLGHTPALPHSFSSFSASPIQCGNRHRTRGSDRRSRSGSQSSGRCVVLGSWFVVVASKTALEAIKWRGQAVSERLTIGLSAGQGSGSDASVSGSKAHKPDS